jgi:peptide subunit release factor 1 (eRF1)
MCTIVPVDADLLQTLSTERGHGTSVVTLYVKPGADMTDLITRMKQEVTTAANIKSRL